MAEELYEQPQDAASGLEHATAELERVVERVEERQEPAREPAPEADVSEVPETPAQKEFIRLRRRGTRAEREAEFLRRELDEIKRRLPTQTTEEAEDDPEPEVDGSAEGSKAWYRWAMRQTIKEQLAPVLETSAKARERQEAEQAWEAEQAERARGYRALAAEALADREEYLAHTGGGDEAAKGLGLRIKWLERDLTEEFMLVHGLDQATAHQHADAAIQGHVMRALQSGHNSTQALDIWAQYRWGQRGGGGHPAEAAPADAPARREIRELRQAAASPAAGSVGQAATRRPAGAGPVWTNAKELREAAARKAREEGVTFDAARKALLDQALKKVGGRR